MGWDNLSPFISEFHASQLFFKGERCLLCYYFLFLSYVLGIIGIILHRIFLIAYLVL